MRINWSIISPHVYILDILDDRVKVNMNIYTYVSTVSMNLKMSTDI